MSSVTFCLFFITTILGTTAAADSKCMQALKRYPKPDANLSGKHLDNNCQELCRSANGAKQGTGHYYHPYDCHAYINCDGNNAWLQYCQPNLEFNENLGVCDWPASAKCPKRSWPTTPAPVTTTPVSAARLIVPPSTTCKDSETGFNQIEYFGNRPDLCTSGSGWYPAPDCRYYVRCNGSDASVAKCPAGFVYDPVKRRCDWPHKNTDCLHLCSTFGNVIIQERTTPTLPPPPTTPATTTHKVTAERLLESTTPRVSGATPKPTIPTTPTTTTTTTTTTTSTTPTTTTTTEPPHDPLCLEAEGNFEYPNDCKKYVTCDKWHASLEDCPTGLVYVEKMKWCNWMWLLPPTHKCYKPFDDGSADCPFYRGTENETYGSTTTVTTAKSVTPMRINY